MPAPHAMSEIAQANLSGGKRHGHTLSIAGLAVARGVMLCDPGLAGAWNANLEVFVVYRAYITVAAVILIVFGWAVALRSTIMSDLRCPRLSYRDRPLRTRH
jgi:hypothetical protein